MPGTAFIEEYFPHTQISAKKTRKVRVAHEVLICRHLLRQRSNCTGISSQEARVTGAAGFGAGRIVDDEAHHLSYVTEVGQDGD